jgi:hypothetical protein
VSRFAQDVVKPKVLEMDETEHLDEAVLKGLFEQGVRIFWFSVSWSVIPSFVQFGLLMVTFSFGISFFLS